MRYNTQLNEKDGRKCLPQFFGIVGWTAWERRINILNKQIEDNPLLKPFFEERFYLELEAGRIHDTKRSTGKSVIDLSDYRTISFISFAYGTWQAYKHSSSAAQNRIKGMIRNGLKSEYGLSPFAFEMRTVTHLISKGFDVFFHDLEKGYGFDFLVSRDDAKIEVECKLISADIGNPIHNRKLRNLGRYLYPILKKNMSIFHKGVIIDLLLPDRLTSNDKQLQEIAETLSESLSSKKPINTPSCCRVSLFDFPSDSEIPVHLVDSENPLRTIANFAEECTGAKNDNMLLLFDPDAGPIVVIIRSQKKRETVRGILEQLKHSCRHQFSTQTPGALCVYLADMSELQLKEIYQNEITSAGLGTPIQEIATTLLQSRPHVREIAFVASGAINQRRKISSSGIELSWQQVGGAYTFKNPSHRTADDPRFDLF